MEKSTIKFLRISLLASCLAASTHAFGDKNSLDITRELVSEKMYVSADQLWLNKDGIFVNLAGEALPITAVFRDKDGLYIDAHELRNNRSPQYECPYGHPSPHGDGRCNQPQEKCPFGR